MRVAYVDTSCLVAVALDEPGGRKLAGSLRGFDRLVSSNLLEAEFRSAMKREEVTTGVEEYLSWLSWITPNQPLSGEISRVLDLGHLRGADLWHLACALHLSPRPGEMYFLSLDERQAAIAAAIGFRG